MPELGFVVADSEEPLVVDTYEAYEWVGGKTISIYDAEGLGLFFDYDSVTPEQIKQVVRDNDGIGQRFKDLLYWYVDAITAKYPEADLRPLYYNLQTIEVVECTTHELLMESLSFDSYGCYKRADNKIYVNKDYEYEPGSWDFQVIIHEFSHAARIVLRNDNGDHLYIQPSSQRMEIPEEALNSLFAVSLFDYEERDIAYQLQSNMFQVLIECLDGKYVLSDYLNHSLSYFAHVLDQHNGHNNYAMTLFQLIEEQRTDYFDDRYERDQEVYYPIYHYLCRMYLDRYAPADRDEETINRLVAELLEKVTFDVPEGYHIDTDEFYRFASTYEREL